jgi:hypothetical protein
MIMPNRDKTGPSGEGAGTGRGRDGCTTEKQLENLRKKDDGKGVGRGGEPRGGGRGNCHGRRKGQDGITYFT